MGTIGQVKYEMRTAGLVERDIACPCVGVFGGAGSVEAQNLDVLLPHQASFANDAEALVGEVEHRLAPFGQGGHGFGFGAGDGLARAQKLDVALAAIGYQGKVGLDEFAKRLQLTRPTHAHLDDDHLGVSVGLQKGLGHAELVVLVGMRGRGGESGRQDVANKVFRGGLAHRTGKGNNGPRQMLAPMRGQIGDCLVGVGHLVQVGVFGRSQLVHARIKIGACQHHCGAGLKCLGDEIVPVYAVTGQGNVHITRGSLTRIPGKARCLNGGIARGGHKPPRDVVAYTLCIQTHV